MFCVSKRSLPCPTALASMAESESAIMNSKALRAAHAVKQWVNLTGIQGRNNVNGCILQGILSLVFETCRDCNAILKWLEPVRARRIFFFHYHNLQAMGFYHNIILFLDLLITFSKPLLFTIKLSGEKFKFLQTTVNVAMKKLTNIDNLPSSIGYSL